MVYDSTKDEAFANTIKNHYNKFYNVNYYVDRCKAYNPAGRFQTEEGARDVDASVLTMLNDHGISYRRVEGSRDGVQVVVNDILTMLGEYR
jgi:hypothetical protein